MFAKLFTAAAVAALSLATVTPTAADAGPRHDREYRGEHRHYKKAPPRYDRRYNNDRRYANNARYYGDRNRNNYRGKSCDKGTGGTIIGAIAGGLLGNEVANNGNGTTGAIIGAGVGALAGRAIDRDC